jgi:hypothetical protein
VVGHLAGVLGTKLGRQLVLVLAFCISTRVDDTKLTIVHHGGLGGVEDGLENLRHVIPTEADTDGDGGQIVRRQQKTGDLRHVVSCFLRENLKNDVLSNAIDTESVFSFLNFGLERYYFCGLHVCKNGVLTNFSGEFSISVKKIHVVMSNKKKSTKKILPTKIPKKLTPQEFSDVAYQYALDRVDTDPDYKWMKTKQPEDLRFERYVKIRWQKGELSLKENQKKYQIVYWNFVDNTITVELAPRDRKGGLLNIMVEKELE